MKHLALTYPHLELSHRIDTDIIRTSFDKVKNIPLCWMAREVLDLQCEQALSERAIQYKIEHAAIVFTHAATQDKLASIYFDRDINFICAATRQLKYQCYKSKR